MMVLLTPCIDYVIVFSGLAGGSSDGLLAAAPFLVLTQMLLLPVYLLILIGPDLVSAIEPGPFVEALVVLIIIPLVAAALTQRWAKRPQAARHITALMHNLTVPMMMLALAIVIGSQIVGVGQELRSLLAVIPIYVAFLIIMVPVSLVEERGEGTGRHVSWWGVVRTPESTTHIRLFVHDYTECIQYLGKVRVSMGSGEPYLYDRSGEQYAIDAPRWRGNDHTPLMVSELPGIGRQDIEGRVRSQWRYRAALPYQLRETISLGEGCTPMLPCHLNGADVLVKPEWFNPTSSYKDRGTSVMLSVLKDQGVTHVLEDSSGNGGSSVAAYAAAAGMKAKVLVPASTSPAKIVQTRRHGAEIELVPGIRQDTADEAVRQSESIFYSSHNWHPFFVQGIKLLAYEIWEDLDFTAPHSVVVPAGSGSLVLGLSIGFTELLRSGQIQQMPKILAVQPENCSPMAQAFAAGCPAPLEGEWKPSLAEGASIARPVRGPEVLKAARESHGAIITVTEDQIRAATTELAHKGLYAEPTSAMVSAALPAFADLGLIRPGERTVLVLTGSALKATAIPE